MLSIAKPMHFLKSFKYFKNFYLFKNILKHKMSAQEQRTKTDISFWDRKWKDMKIGFHMDKLHPYVIYLKCALNKIFYNKYL